MPPLPTSRPCSRPLPRPRSLSPVARACVCLLLHGLAAPVIAQVRDAPLQKLVFGVGISTDSGPRLSMDHIHNRLPALSWRAVSKLALDNKRRLAATDWTALPSASGWRWFSGARSAPCRVCSAVQRPSEK